MKRILISIIFTFSIAGAYCAPAGELAAPPQAEMRSQCIMTQTTGYSSTVYEPFSDVAPSDCSPGESSSGHSGPRKGKITGPDTPPGQESPVGEPWIMLLCGAAFAAVLAWRKRNKCQSQDL